MARAKVLDRKERFKAPEAKVYAPTEAEKQEVDARKARFGVTDEQAGGEKKKKDFRALEFSLDDYKSKKDKHNKKFKKGTGFKNKENGKKFHGKPGGKKQFHGKRKF